MGGEQQGACSPGDRGRNRAHHVLAAGKNLAELGPPAPIPRRGGFSEELRRQRFARRLPPVPGEIPRVFTLGMATEASEAFLTKPMRALVSISVWFASSGATPCLYTMPRTRGIPFRDFSFADRKPSWRRAPFFDIGVSQRARRQACLREAVNVAFSFPTLFDVREQKRTKKAGHSGSSVLALRRYLKTLAERALVPSKAKAIRPQQGMSSIRCSPARGWEPSPKRGKFASPGCDRAAVKEGDRQFGPLTPPAIDCKEAEKGSSPARTGASS